MVSELLSDPKRWTKGFYAKDKWNVPIGIHSTDAAKFCLVGACCKVYRMDTVTFYTSEIYKRLINVLRRIEHSHNLTDYNDASTHDEVLALVKDANV